jgi:DNA-binding transcriptional LysR family regulator
MNQLHLITVFIAVVDTNGFAGAARKLSMSPPAVTRAINALEAHLGLRLLTRTTRTVRVTDAGERYAHDCRRILAELLEADESVSGMHLAPKGRLTITAPVLFGSQYVTPIVTEYLGRYPQVTISCLFLDRMVNLLEEGVDAAIRIGELPDSSLQAVAVGHVRRVICASPDYLALRGTPQVPDDLQTHTIVSVGGQTAHTDWRLLDKGSLRSVRLHARMTTTTNDSALRAALEGFGLTRLLSYQAQTHLRTGQLQAVLSAYEPAPLPIHVVHRQGRQAPQRVRAFLDMAIERLRFTFANTCT